ncbi:hypothetical protein Ahy_A01g002767 [Arachis hypogaea]|uniref:Aminotransferase-like plant mobile domain-containing protein n=1 Tax=Arachis hypogaea TaxID=3818 RepID=A0A445ERC7_ARAHY|nr:hypothetical protein Ahy_A01g002767 [Arachis hypogaea]
MLLFGTILFGDKFGTAVHSNFLPLLCNFASISEFSWESACLTHLYKSLCKTSRFDCKKVDVDIIGNVLTDYIDFILLLTLGSR